MSLFRSTIRHFAFAYGPHVCLGMHLVHIEMERALNTVLDRLPNMRLDPANPRPKIMGLHSRSPDAVHVLFDPA